MTVNIRLTKQENDKMSSTSLFLIGSLSSVSTAPLVIVALDYKKIVATNKLSLSGSTESVVEKFLVKRHSDAPRI